MWPAHYREFWEKHNLASAEAEVPKSSDHSGVGASIGLFNEADATDEAENLYPGLIVKDDGFVPIGSDLTGGGDPFFINTHDKPPGPVYCIYHDSVADRNYDRDDAICKVLDSYELILKFLVGRSAA